MKISLQDAGSQLPELFRRATAGDDVVLIQGHDAVQLVPVRIAAKPTAEEKHALFARIRDMARAEPPSPGPDAARSQDFLYDDEDGMPK